MLSNSTFDSSDDAICLKSTGTAPCEDVIISNGIAIKPLDTDPRPVVMAEDVIGLIIKGVNKGSNCQATEWFKQKDVSFCKTEFELPE